MNATYYGKDYYQLDRKNWFSYYRLNNDKFYDKKKALNFLMTQGFTKQESEDYLEELRREEHQNYYKNH